MNNKNTLSPQDRDIHLKLYETMLVCREAENAIRAHYNDNDMKTPMHMSLGEEAIVAGVRHALGSRIIALGTYRSHALYLAVTGDLEGFFGEMYGRVSGPARGRGGSMHLIAPSQGLLLTSAIVASHIPVALGAAFASKTNNWPKIGTVFFGDGAIDEGAFWESMNVACAMSLPVFFICQDNGLAVHAPRELRQGYSNIAQIIRQFDCHVLESDSTDVVDLHQLACEALRLHDIDKRPCFLHLKYHRYLEHVGINEDYDAGYRSRETYDEWLKRDPLDVQRSRLLELGYESIILELENTISAHVKGALAKAQSADHPDPSSVCQGVWA
jgi:pyruvate dehydrogenase E1 component alpha subunit